jgi:hypothetical protein
MLHLTYFLSCIHTALLNPSWSASAAEWENPSLPERGPFFGQKPLQLRRPRRATRPVAKGMQQGGTVLEQYRINANGGDERMSLFFLPDIEWMA